MMAFVSVILVVSALEDLRTNVALSVGPTGVIEQVESKVVAEIRSEVVQLGAAQAKLDAATTTTEKKQARFDLQAMLMILTLYAIGASMAASLARLMAMTCVHCICCWGRTRVTDEDKASFPANGTLDNVRCTGFLNLKGLLECLFCTDVLWMENASKMGHMGKCCGFLMLVVSEACVILVLLVAIAVTMITSRSAIEAAQEAGLDGTHGVVTALISVTKFVLTTFPWPGYPVWLLLTVYGYGVYTRSMLRAKMQGSEPNHPVNVATHCCFICPAGDAGVVFPNGMAVYQEAEYVEVYGKDHAGGGAAAPLQAPAQATAGAE